MSTKTCSVRTTEGRVACTLGNSTRTSLGERQRDDSVELLKWKVLVYALTKARELNCRISDVHFFFGRSGGAGFHGKRLSSAKETLIASETWLTKSTPQ